MDQEKAASAKMARAHACCGYNGFEFHDQLVPWQQEQRVPWQEEEERHQYCWYFLSATQTPYVVNTGTNSWATAEHCFALPDCVQGIPPSESNEVRLGKLKRRKEKYIAMKLEVIKNIAKKTKKHALVGIASNIAFCLTPGLDPGYEAREAVNALAWAKMAWERWPGQSEEELKSVWQKCIYKIRDLLTVRVQIDALPIGSEDRYREALSRAHRDYPLDPQEFSLMMLSYWKTIVQRFEEAFPTNQMKVNLRKGGKRLARKRKRPKPAKIEFSSSDDDSEEGF